MNKEQATKSKVWKRPGFSIVVAGYIIEHGREGGVSYTTTVAIPQEEKKKVKENVTAFVLQEFHSLIERVEFWELPYNLT